MLWYDTFFCQPSASSKTPFKLADAELLVVPEKDGCQKINVTEEEPSLEVIFFLSCLQVKIDPFFEW